MLLPHKVSAQNGSKVMGDNGRVYSLHVSVIPYEDVTEPLTKKGTFFHFFRGVLCSNLDDLVGSKDDILSCLHAHGISFLKIKGAWSIGRGEEEELGGLRSDKGDPRAKIFW